jgi:HEAT repeat protein
VLLLIVGGLAAFLGWPRSASIPPDDALALLTDAFPQAEDDAASFEAPLAANEEEWLDDRPLPEGPADPPKPSLGPATNIALPEHPAKGIAPPPLPRRGGLARFQRRDVLSEAEWRQRLAKIPEIGLDRELMPSLVWEYKERQAASLASLGSPDFSPRPLYDLYPDVKGLSMRRGSEAQLDSRRAATLDALSRKLRVYVSHFAPADREGKRPGAAELRAVMYNELRGGRPEWLRPEAIPVLMQMLCHEDVVLRHLLVEILSEIKHRTATVALAQRASCDLDADIRAFAIDALRPRSKDDYMDVFLRALRHPQPMLADHAAEALVALAVKEAVPSLIIMLKEPSPTAPYLARDGRLLIKEVVRTNHLANCLLCHPPSVTYQDPVPGVIPNARWVYPVIDVRPGAPSAQGLVSRVNSFTSGTTSTGTTSQTGCHDYSASAGIVPNVKVPSSRPSSGGSGGNGSNRNRLATTSQTQVRIVRQPSRPQANVTTVTLPVLVRGDITFLRQDFSVSQTVANPPLPNVPGPQPLTVEMRFDYFVRARRATPEEARASEDTGSSPNYPQRDAVLFALRGLTGQDAGSTTQAWQQLFPDAEMDNQSQKLAAGVARATGADRLAALERLREGKGSIYTEALAAAIGRLSGDNQEKAREALVQRLSRMTAATLRNKLAEESPEVRRAAALACADKEDASHIPDLLERLDDADSAVARAVRVALGKLSGQDFATAQQWKEWWKKQGAE